MLNNLGAQRVKPFRACACGHMPNGHNPRGNSDKKTLLMLTINANYGEEDYS